MFISVNRCEYGQTPEKSRDGRGKGRIWDSCPCNYQRDGYLRIFRKEQAEYKAVAALMEQYMERYCVIQ